MKRHAVHRDGPAGEKEGSSAGARRNSRSPTKYVTGRPEERRKADDGEDV